MSVHVQCDVVNCFRPIGFFIVTYDVCLKWEFPQSYMYAQVGLLVHALSILNFDVLQHRWFLFTLIKRIRILSHPYYLIIGLVLELGLLHLRQPRVRIVTLGSEDGVTVTTWNMQSVPHRIGIKPRNILLVWYSYKWSVQVTF